MVYSESEVISVRDLYCPVFSKSQDDEATVQGLLEDTNKSFGDFVELFNQSVIKGDYQRFGRKATLKRSCLMAGDFVSVFFPSKLGHKYGVLQSPPKNHLAQVLILVRRNQDGSDRKGIQEFDVKNISMLHRPVKVKV
jgi:hypothetical protein